MVNIPRINELAKKAREVGLTPEEKEEQRILRQEYVDSITGGMRSQLDNTYIVEKDGTKTPLK